MLSGRAYGVDNDVLSMHNPWSFTGKHALFWGSWEWAGFILNLYINTVKVTEIKYEEQKNILIICTECPYMVLIKARFIESFG